MRYSKDNLKYTMATPLEWYLQWHDDLGGQGFRTISLSLAGPTSAPVYSAVMVKLDHFFRGQSASLEKTAMEHKIDELAALPDPLYPYIIAATGSGSDVLYAACFRELAKKPVVRLKMTATEYQNENATQRKNGRILLWVDAFGTENSPRYCAIWVDNTDGIGWNAEETEEKDPLRQQRFDALKSIDARPQAVTLTPGAGTAHLYVDQRLKHPWVSTGHANGNTFEKVLDEQERAGRFPIRIATTVTNEVRYSGIFARSDETLPRTFRARGPYLSTLDFANLAKAVAIDDYMESYVRAHNLRGAAVAVVDGTRLVFARGYTFAEADENYQDVQPTTLFRMASVSKTFCALAVWKALADGSESRNSRMQDILQLKRANGSAPKAPKFSDIRLKHLLESRSGIDQGLLRDEVHRVAADENGAAQPLGLDYFKQLIAERDLLADPGKLSAYGRVDYFLLSLVAMKLANANTFDSALKTLLFDPLHMTHTRSSTSRIEQRRNDEALHHPPDLGTNVSAVHADRRLVPTTYGYDNYEVYLGAGGLSSAVIDLARLGATLNCRSGNPLFSTATLDDLLSDAVAATSAGTAHGYHGFDWAKDFGTYIELEKGGGLDGVGAGLWGKTGRRFIALARNGAKVDGATPVDWKRDIDAIAAPVNWGGGDLFSQSFGMPSL